MSAAESVPRRDGAPIALALTLTGALAAILIPGAELPPDVAYYAQWARHPPQAGYLDHPGAVAWPLAWLPTSAHATALRVLPLAVMAAQSWLVARTLQLANPSASRWGLAALICSPLWLAGALLWTPDAPLLLGWHLGLLAALGGLASGWLVVAAALMSAAKISGLLLCGVWVIALWKTAARRAALAALVVSLAVTAMTGRQALWFQLTHRQPSDWSLWRLLLGPLEVLGGALLLMGPALGLWALWRGRRAHPPRDVVTRVCGVCAVGAIAPWMLLGMWTHIEANWLAPAVLPLLCVLLRGAEDSPLRRVVVAQATLVLALAAQLHFAILPLDAADPTRRLRGWSRWSAAFPTRGASLVLADRYQWASTVGLRRDMDGATFDAIEAGAAKRPSALDGLVSLTPKRALLIWRDHPPSEALRARWPTLCEAGHVDARADEGPPLRVRYELRAHGFCRP